MVRSNPKSQQAVNRIKELNKLISACDEIQNDVFFCKIDPIELQVKDKIYNNSGYRESESYVIKDRVVTKEGLFIMAEGVGEEDGDVLFLQLTRSRTRNAGLYY